MIKPIDPNNPAVVTAPMSTPRVPGGPYPDTDAIRHSVAAGALDRVVWGGYADPPPALTADQLENIEMIIEELMNQFNEAESEGRPGINLVSALGAKFHKRVERAQDDLWELAKAKHGQEKTPTPDPR